MINLTPKQNIKSLYFLLTFLIASPMFILQFKECFCEVLFSAQLLFLDRKTMKIYNTNAGGSIPARTPSTMSATWLANIVLGV